MIDLHCHAIYDVDDGSKNIEQTIRMLKMAQAVGYDKICLTPHYMEDGYKTSKVVLNTKLERIEKVAKTEGINVKLYLGEEIFVYPDLPENLNDIISLNNTKYLLIEIPLLEEIQYLDDVIYRLQSYGAVPILAHPERYFKTFKDFKFVENLASKGVLLQMNINSLTGHYGKDAQKLAVKMIKKDMISFVATDSHSSAGYNKCSESLEVLRKMVSPEKFEELTEINPNKILNNEDVLPWDGKYASVTKKKFFFFKNKNDK